MPIRHDPDEAGLIGAVHLAPTWMFKGHDAILAVDIGGTNIRAGVVELNLKKAPDLSKAAVWKFELWRHGDEKKLTREDAVDELVEDAQGLITRAEQGRTSSSRRSSASAAPASSKRTARSTAARRTCRATGRAAASICRRSLHKAIPKIGEHETAVLLHNDAVVQGLSEVPFMSDVEALGRADDRHRARQRPLHQPRRRPARIDDPLPAATMPKKSRWEEWIEAGAVCLCQGSLGRSCDRIAGATTTRACSPADRA